MSIMRLTIGSTPADEPCAQLGEDGYEERARAECLRLKDLVVRRMGPPPGRTLLLTCGHSHDLGIYYEVSVQYDDADVDGELYALAAQDNPPLTWDDDSRVEWRKQ